MQVVPNRRRDREFDRRCPRRTTTQKAAHRAAVCEALCCSEVGRPNRPSRSLFELHFFELDVFTSTGVVFLEDKLVLHRLAVFAFDVEIAGAGGRLELDELTGAFGHGGLLIRARAAQVDERSRAIGCRSLSARGRGDNIFAQGDGSPRANLPLELGFDGGEAFA